MPRDESLCRWIEISSGILEFKFVRSEREQRWRSGQKIQWSDNLGGTVGRDAVARDSVAEQRNKVPHHSRTPADSQARS